MKTKWLLLITLPFISSQICIDVSGAVYFTSRGEFVEFDDQSLRIQTRAPLKEDSIAASKLNYTGLTYCPPDNCFYAIKSANSGPILVRIEPSLDVITVGAIAVSGTQVPASAEALEYSPSDENLWIAYGSTRNRSDRLGIINRTNANVTLLHSLEGELVAGELIDMDGIAFEGTNLVLYVTDARVTPDDSYFYQIGVSGFTVSGIGFMGSLGWLDIAYDPISENLLAGSRMGQTNVLGTVDTLNGKTTPFFSLAGEDASFGLAFGPSSFFEPRLDIRISHVEICWATRPGVVYQLQYKSQLDPDVAVDLGDPVVGNGDTFCTNDTVAVGDSRKFYQVHINPVGRTQETASSWPGAPGQ